MKFNSAEVKDLNRLVIEYCQKKDYDLETLLAFSMILVSGILAAGDYDEDDEQKILDMIVAMKTRLLADMEKLI